MQPVCRLAPSQPGTTCQARVTALHRRGTRVALTAPPRPRARASCVGAGGSGTTEPVAQSARQSVIRDPQAEAAAAEELESLEAAAIAGEDEGRQPTDYDRRARIFEESSRVFRELKQRRDVRGGGVQGAGDGAAAETAPTREPQQLG